MIHAYIDNESLEIFFKNKYKIMHVEYVSSHLQKRLIISYLAQTHPASCFDTSAIQRDQLIKIFFL